MTKKKRVQHFVDGLKGNACRVIDGDTVEVLLDRGWKEEKTVSARIYGIDTPEVRKTKQGGALEKEAGRPVRVQVGGERRGEWAAGGGGDVPTR